MTPGSRSPWRGSACGRARAARAPRLGSRPTLRGARGAPDGGAPSGPTWTSASRQARRPAGQRQRLESGLLGREARRVVLGRVALSLAVRDLSGREELGTEAGIVPPQLLLQAGHFEKIHAEPEDHCQPSASHCATSRECNIRAPEGPLTQDPPAGGRASPVWVGNSPCLAERSKMGAAPQASESAAQRRVTTQASQGCRPQPGHVQGDLSG